MDSDKLLNLLEKKFINFLDEGTNLYEIPELTIIIPTYNRAKYLIRQIIYLSKCSASLIIVDGSKNKIDCKIIEQLKIIKNLKYFHSADLSYVDRIKYACKQVKSKYVMCLAEDDFIIFNGVARAINTLSKDISLISCFGQVAGLEYHENKKPYLIKYGSSLKNYYIDHVNPIEKLMFVFNSYRSFTPYSVYKKKYFVEIWSRIETSSCLELTEYEHTINTLLMGKTKIIGDLLWIRSQELESLDSKQEGSRKNTFKYWYNSEKFVNEVTKFRERTTKNLMNYLNCSNTEAVSILNKLISKILNSKNHKGLDESNFIKKIIKSLKSLVVSFSFFLMLYNILIKNKIGIQLRLLLRKISNKTIKNHHSKKDFIEVERILKITEIFHN